MKAIANKKIRKHRIEFGDELKVRYLNKDAGYAEVVDENGKYFALLIEDINLKPE